MFNSLSFTSGKWDPIIFEDAEKEIPFRKPNNFETGIKMNRINKNSSTKINTQNKIVLADGFNHKKYSINKVKNRYKKPKVKNKIPPFINSFT